MLHQCRPVGLLGRRIGFGDETGTAEIDGRFPRMSGVGPGFAVDVIRWVELHFGFAEKPDVPAAVAAHAEEVGCDPTTASFFLGRETPVPSLRPEVPRWQESLYAFMVRNAVSAPDYFLIQPQRVVELGTRVEL